MKTSLKTIVCRALDDQDVQGNLKVEVAKVSPQAYNVQITVDGQYLDDVDEMYIYDIIADTDYCDCDINIEVVDVTDAQDKLDYVNELSDDFDTEERPEDSNKSDGELMAEADDLRVFDINEDTEDYEYDDDEEDYFDDSSDDSDYAVTWSDLEEFEKEFGEKYE